MTVGIQNGAAATATVTIFRYGQRNRYELRMGAHASRQIRVAAGTTIEIKADAPIAVAAVRKNETGRVSIRFWASNSPRKIGEPTNSRSCFGWICDPCRVCCGPTSYFTASGCSTRAASHADPRCRSWVRRRSGHHYFYRIELSKLSGRGIGHTGTCWRGYLGRGPVSYTHLTLPTKA